MFGDFRDEVGLLALSKTPSRAPVGYPGGTSVKKKKNSPANAGEVRDMQVRSLGQEDPLATHSSILAWRIP